MVLDSDVALRLKTSCSTTFSHYDQVVAVSQKIINQAFEGLYDENPEWAKIDYSSKFGSINGDLYSPRILLGGRKGSQLTSTAALYVMRFKGGKLVIAGDDSGDHEEDLKDWNLAVSIDLNAQFVVVDPNADPEEQARQQKIWDFIHSKFSIPGDYSVTRLYAKLSDATWDDFDYEASQFGTNENGTPRSWAQLIKQFPDLEYVLQIFLKKWAKEQEDDCMTMIGVKMTLEQSKNVNPEEPTFQPTAMIHQVFPYKNPAKGVDEPVVSYDVPGNLNTLLYCEMVEDHPLPEEKQLASRGIFTTQASSTTQRIDGSFVLSHQLFLEKFLHPMLNAFNMASIIYPESSSFSYIGGDSTVYWNYAIGCDKDHRDPNDQFYSFTPVYNPGTPEDVTAYKFSWTRTDTLTPTGHNPNSGVWGSFTATGTSAVDFKWEPGSNSFNITGTSEYKYDGEWADNGGMQRPFGWLRDTYKFTWSMKIDIVSVEGGILQMGLDAGPKSDCNGVLTMTRHEQQQTQTPPGQTENIRNVITSQISKQVQTLKKNLLEKFQTTGQLTYPGCGAFDFSSPVIGNTGEILATISFKDAASKIDVPPPRVPDLDRLQGIPFHAFPVSTPCETPITKLYWSFSKPVKGGSKATEVLISGINNSDKPISLSSLALTLSSAQDGQGLVTGIDFKADEWTIGEPDEDKLHVFQIMVGTDGTPAFTDVTADAGEETPHGITPITFSGTGDVSIEPGNSITVALFTGTGLPNTYPVSVIEGWPKEKEKADRSLSRGFNVILSP